MTGIDQDTDARAESALAGLRRPLRLTRMGMALERLLRAFWPAWTILLVCLAALGFGLHRTVSAELFWGGAGLAGLALLAALLRGARRFRWPRRDEALDRLDRSLAGRPISALADRQAIGGGDAASTAVWRAHMARMADRVAGVGPRAPDLRLADRDPYALRYAALLALVAALAFGTLWRSEGLGALAPGAGGADVAAGPSYEGWIEPPAYTGKPSIYLNEAEDRATLDLPEGSRVTLRLYGEVGALSVRETVSGRPVAPEADAASAPAQEFTIARDGEIAIAGARDLSWQIDVIPDAPPEVALTGEIARSVTGQATISFEASDDYGVQTGTVEIDLDLDTVDRRHGQAVAPEPRDPIVLDLPMPYGGDRTAFEDQLVEDLAKHPWAGLAVTVTPRVEDAAGQAATGSPARVALPGRRFFEPLAAAIAEQRRDLLWSRENGRRVAQVLRAVTHRPEDVFSDETAYLVTRTAIRRLETGLDTALSEATRDEVAELLWKAALLIEEGDLSDALARLRRAEERLQEALEQGASSAEIAELMDELRQAMRDYMEQMAREALQNPDQQLSQDQMQQGQQMTSQDLQEMMDRIQELAEQGRTAEAQQLLEQLRQMMENMRMAQGQGQQGQNPGEQAMQGLQDTLRQQQGLSDEAFRELQDRFNQGQQGQQGQQSPGPQGQQGQRQPGQQGQNGQQPGQPGQGMQPGQPGQGQQPGQPGASGQQPGAEELAERQRALRELLRDQQQNLPGAGTAEGEAARESLDQAGRAMDRAGEDLEQGDLPGALDNQAEAMQALREGIQNLGEAMAQQQQQPGQGQQGQDFGEVPPGERRDPLGRRAGSNGRIGTEENMLPGEEIFRRSQELLDEIRRRSGDRTRPDFELDYLERLLDRF